MFHKLLGIAAVAALVSVAGYALAQTSAGTNATLYQIFFANNTWNGTSTFAGAATFTGGLTSTLPVPLPSYTVATLPTCSSTVNTYALAVVTDATTPTYNGTLTGGSTVIVPVFCSGAAWKSH